MTRTSDLVIIDGNPLDDHRRSQYVSCTMINGRLYEAATMNQIAPEAVVRQDFYFEEEGGDTVQPASMERPWRSNAEIRCTH